MAERCMPKVMPKCNRLRQIFIHPQALAIVLAVCATSSVWVSWCGSDLPAAAEKPVSYASVCEML